MSLKEDKIINTIENYNNKFSKIKKRNFFYNNNINLTAIEPIENIYETYHQKKKNKVLYENKNRSMNKIKKLQIKKNILSNISLNTTSTFNNNNNNIQSLPFVQTSTNSTFDFKTHTTTNTSFNKTLKKNYFSLNNKKILNEYNKKSNELNYIYFPDNNKINPNDYYYTSTYSFPDLMNKTEIKKNVFNKSLYEKLMYFDNLINKIKKSDIQTTSEYIINKSKFNNLNIKAPECVIHNVFLNLIVNDIFHKIEIRNEMNKFINYDYVINLLNEEIFKFKKNIFKFYENENSSKTINTELSNDYLNYIFNKSKIKNNNNNENDINNFINNFYGDDNFVNKNSLNKFRLNINNIKNFDKNEKKEEVSKNETIKKINNNNNEIDNDKQKKNNNNDIINLFNDNNKISSKIHNKNFEQKNIYIKDKNGNLISISNDDNYKLMNKNGELYYISSSGKEILIDKNSSLISKDNKGNEIIISSDLNKN